MNCKNRNYHKGVHGEKDKYGDKNEVIPKLVSAEQKI